MTPEEQQALTMPKHLDEIKGLPQEVRQKKIELIRKFGYTAYEQLIKNSSRSAVR